MILDNKILEKPRSSKKRELPPPMVISNLYSAFDLFLSESFYFAGESHEFHEVVYVLSGNVIVTEDERIYHLTKGNLIIHAPWEFHRISTNQSARIMVFTFTAKGLFPQTLYDSFFDLSPEMRETFNQLFKEIRSFIHDYTTEEDMNSDEYINLAMEISSALPSFLFSLIRTHTPNSATSVHLGSEAEYKRIVETMQQSVNENLSLEEIAALNHISVSYIKHLFQRYAGIGAKKYYDTLRLNEITRLLKHGMRVSDIAQQLKFSSPEYMSFFFKKHMGIPPGAWQSKNRK